jgi:enoyl-CoA hydratase/carnithine racemase
MTSPASLLCEELFDGFRFDRELYRWSEGRSSLELDLIEYRGEAGAVLTYTNPPVHQIGNPGLEAMLEALTEVEDAGGAFLLLTWPCDPVHAGGDLKESFTRLESTTSRRDELEAAGAPAEQIEALYDWADGRLDKGQALYRAIRRLSLNMTTVGVCGGGLRFGGSAEVNLMADRLVGDSRSGMCFSEAMIGLIPGWAGVGRAVTKAGALNARFMAQTATTVMASDLRRIGLYDEIVEIAEPLPTMSRTGDKAADKARYLADLERHDRRVYPRLIQAGCELALRPAKDVEAARSREHLAPAEEIASEVARRAAPETYASLWGRPLKEATQEIAELGRPLAPQSVAELTTLFADADSGSFDEDAFVEAEKQADARLYRDRRLARGIQATLEQRVADFRRLD